jgi:UDP-GlcNAc:undecaprenyl-phosphate GlcNAc-1-phosphate transferase
MLASRTSHIGESLLARSKLCETDSRQRSVQLQGNRCWDDIWSSLVEFADDRGLAQLKLDIGIAWMHEGYHGAWRRSQMPDKTDQASLKLPIYVDQRLVGRLEVICNAKSPSLNITLQLLLDRASELSDQIKRLMDTSSCLTSVNDTSAAVVNIVGIGNLGENAFAQVDDSVA